MTNALLNSSKTKNQLYADAIKGIIPLEIYKNIRTNLQN